MEPVEQLSVILPAVSDLVDRIDPADLHAPTPCERFVLRDVLDHMIVLGGAFSHLFRGQEPPGDAAPDDDGRVPAAVFRKVMEDLLDAVRSEGAMRRTIAAPVGTMPGEAFARLVAFDGLVHGWDIARATGLPYELPDDVVAAVDTFAQAAIPNDLRDGVTFKDPAPAPPTATPIERVAAFSGRSV
jgi:uncharacterized protein (TIGR03086 family)